MKYKICANVHKWKQEQHVEESELLSEGVNISQWIMNGLITVDVPVKEVKIETKKENPLDLNNDGKVDAEDGKIASSVLNMLKKKGKK